MPSQRLATSLLAAAALCAAAAPAQAAPHVDGEFDVSGTPGHVALGPDGNVWVTLSGATNDVARVTPDGTVTEFDLAPAIASAGGITAGPDGNMWLTKAGGVARFSPAAPAGVEAFAIADITDPRGITTGPDGNLWAASGDKAVRIPPASPTGFTSFTVAGMGARGIARSGDLLWIADFGSQRIVSVTAAGVSTPYTVGGGPQEVAGGPDGQVAFTNPGAVPQHVGRLSPGGTPAPTETPSSDPFGVVLGSDGAYWTANFASGDLTRLTTAGDATRLGGLSAGSGPRYIASGAGNTLWVSLETAKKVARVVGVDPPAPPATGDQPNPGSDPGPLPAISITSLRIARSVRIPARPTVRWRLSRDAATTFTVVRRLAGGRLRTVGSVTAAGTAGANRLALPRRIGGHALRAGRYRLTASAGTSKRSVSFRLLARKR